MCKGCGLRVSEVQKGHQNPCGESWTRARLGRYEAHTHPPHQATPQHPHHPACPSLVRDEVGWMCCCPMGACPREEGAVGSRKRSIIESKKSKDSKTYAACIATERFPSAPATPLCTHHTHTHAHPQCQPGEQAVPQCFKSVKKAHGLSAREGRRGEDQSITAHIKVKGSEYARLGDACVSSRQPQACPTPAQTKGCVQAFSRPRDKAGHSNEGRSGSH